MTALRLQREEEWGQRSRKTFAPAVDPVTALDWCLGVIALTVSSIITLLLLPAVLYPRPALPRASKPAVQTRTGDKLGWLYCGIVLSAIVLCVFTS